MNRFAGIGLILLALLVIPAGAFAQKDTRQTREASKYIGLAMTRQTDDERAEMYRQAMEHLRQGMAEDAENAQVWKLAGSALAALGELEEADRAFTRAVELHPEYAEEVEGERENAWITAFNHGIQLMDEQRYDEAIAMLEGAQTIYDQRPEGLMNLGALYANAGETAKAVQALRDAIDATNGPVFERLDAEQQAEWARYRGLATSNIAQILAQDGVRHFEAEQFDSAAARFLEAAEANPVSRDYWFNYGQALWAQAAPLEESLDSASAADSATVIAQLNDLYDRIQDVSQKTREFDPNNDVIYLMEARSHRMRGEFDPAQRDAAQATALQLLEAHEALPVTIDGISIMVGEDGSAMISGTVTNRKVAQGGTVSLKFTLYDLSGEVIGEQDVVVTMPAAEETAQFEQTAPVTGEVAGWKYVVTS